MSTNKYHLNRTPLKRAYQKIQLPCNSREKSIRRIALIARNKYTLIFIFKLHYFNAIKNINNLEHYNNPKIS